MAEDRAAGGASRVAPGPDGAETLPPPDGRAAASLRYCHQITRRHARNFYYGLRLTPEPKRSALYTIYAFMRACDDLADRQTAAPATPDARAEALAMIEEFRQKMVRVMASPEPPSDPAASVWPAFHYVVHHFPVDAAYLHAMLDGQRADLLQDSYRCFDDLYGYCYNVAGVVGLVCISIWGTDADPAAPKLAECRGVAFQLTNILRDLVEDARRGRVYLPREELKRFGYDAKLLVRGEANEAFDRLMAFQIDRARGYYERSVDLDRSIDPVCRPTSWAIHRIYRGLLEKIAADPRKVLSGRVRLSGFQKAGIALAAAWKRGL